MPLFDSYLMVDWSANSKPKTGKDSIWWCLVERTEGKTDTVLTKNPSTRTQATDQIKLLLLEQTNKGNRVLVGFDFAYCYPKGLASQLGLAPDEALG